MTMSHVSSYDRPASAAKSHVLRVFWAVVVGSMVVTALFGFWPELFGFVVKVNSFSLQTISGSPIHLTDDVMISLRAGHILNETGRPAFNHADLAQPSTSYVTPYLFAALARIFPENAAVAAFAFLGLFSVGLTFGFIYLFAKSKINAIILVTALVLTATNFYYALNGWDHLFQAMFLTLAAGLALQTEANRRNLFIGAIALVFGSLFRPDGMLIALAILWAFFCSSKSHKQFFAYCFVPFAALLVAAFTINYLQFGHFTPTTARLKLGAAPSLIYTLKEFAMSGLASYSSVSIILVLSLFYVIFFKQLSNRKNLPIFLACCLTCAVAFYNSDFFPHARMYWVSACVMAMIIATSAPRIFSFAKNGREAPVTIGSAYGESFLSLGRNTKRHPFTRIFVPLVVIFAAACIALSLFLRLKNSVVKTDQVVSSAFAQQYFIVDWMNRNLNPADGALGFYYLGVSYHAPKFEIADFLGKADEAIATSQMRQGMPGHNKWDYDITLNKWNLQAIMPPSPSDPSAPFLKDIAEKIQTESNHQNYPSELIVNERVNNEFSYCYVRDPQNRLLDKWGFFLRKDLVERHKDQLFCH